MPPMRSTYNTLPTVPAKGLTKGVPVYAVRAGAPRAEINEQPARSGVPSGSPTGPQEVPMRSRRMTLPRGRLSAATAAAFIALIAVVAPACNSEKPGAVKLYCDQPRIPPGVPPFAVVIDEVTGPTDGQDVKMPVAFKQKTKRDDVYAALHFLYRYAMTRNTFAP